MITVLTPTYNRAATLSRLFQSLCTQSNMSFEWLVVDDGSNDGTYDLINEFSTGAPFTIRVVRQENSGKHVALNNGIAKAHSPWVFIVDSDDALITTAIEDIECALSDLDSGPLVGVCYRRAYFNLNVIGRDSGLNCSPVVMSPTEAGNFFKGDLAYVFKAEVLLKYPFPVVKGEKFVPELFIWNKVGDEGDIYFFGDKAIYLSDYLDDGYSKNFSSNLRKNPTGFLIFYWAQIFRERKYSYKVKNFLRAIQCFFYKFLNRIL
ncbi:glycosyltransferase family 2 protein [Pseudomonas protegens]|uniref:glycosyltransferase family 2 protein n=1 Tax=Pseudomonas protegens TaxID=380021 RepID=UPI00160D8CEE|nr:glycosyltransferase family 2 protein [Pseudomonas protegens]